MWKKFKVKRFFSNQEKEQIIEAIQVAERETSGEIRVHIESSSGSDPLRRAWEMFENLKMKNTKLRNGVLIYLAISDQNFAIIGDQGINEVVPENFWDDTKDKMAELFKKGQFTEGICLGIQQTGEHLAKHFPYQTDDVNELDNDLSIEE